MKNRTLKIAFFAFDCLLLLLLAKCAVDAGRLRKNAPEDIAMPITAVLPPQSQEKTEDDGQAQEGLETARYAVIVYLQNINGKGYRKTAETWYEGTVGTYTTVQGAAIKGFSMLPVDQELISADGSTQISIFYNREQFSYSFDYANGTSPHWLTGRYGEKVHVSTPRKKGYTFNSWNPAVPATFGAVPYTSFTATYNLEGDYEIRYELSGGENNAENPASYNVETGRITLQPATRYGYAFSGWYADSELTEPLTEIPEGSTGSRTLYAGWKATVFTVTFDLQAQGVKDADSFTPRAVSYDRTYGLLPQPIRAGYTFTGWNLSPDGTGAAVYAGTPVTQTEDHTLYAQWQAKTYTVSYNANEGIGTISSVTAPYDSTVELPANAFFRDGYSFYGWATEKKPLEQNVYSPGEHIPVTRSFTVFAIWKPHAYTIRFDANGGEGEMQSLPTLYDAKTALPKSLFSRSGWQFAGWSLDKNAATADYSDRISVKNLTPEDNKAVTLYAVWWQPTISFDIGEGSSGGTGQQVLFGKTSTLKTAEELSLQRIGYTFSGWSTTYGSEKITYTDGQTVTLTKDTKLYAVWTPNTYAVTFVADGIAKTRKTVTYEKKYNALPEPELH
ncbi:MAG: InlB B-repeat-containing protein, partial [Treponema sp.]|nr:InlB B-repeat-containing protein [Treponema sp.]